MCCDTKAGSYLRLIDSCITQLKALGPSRTCNESKEKEEEHLVLPGRERVWIERYGRRPIRIHVPPEGRVGVADHSWFRV